MVKRKTQPKSKEKAGYAARTAQPVHDSTQSSSNESSDGDSSEPEQQQPQRRQQPPPPPMQQRRGQYAAKSTAPNTSNRIATAKIPRTENTTAITKKKTTPGLKALKDIKLLQKTTNLLIPRAPFIRLIKELIQERSQDHMKVTAMAVDALREASESFLTSMFEDSYMLALHAKRVTLFPRDISLLLHLRHDSFLSTLH